MFYNTSYINEDSAEKIAQKVSQKENEKYSWSIMKGDGQAQLI